LNTQVISKALNPPRVLLADDNPTVLDAVSRMLTPVFEIVGRVSNGVSLIAEARKLRPDVMVVDLSMPELGGLEAARELKRGTGRTLFRFISCSGKKKNHLVAQPQDSV
jgi:CheY-like chemotaxis protein